jgi:hypothetical protein
MLRTRIVCFKLVILITLIVSPAAFAQMSSYPKEIRGYKVTRATVEVKKPAAKKTKEVNEDQSKLDLDPEALIRFGDPEVARVTPLGISLEIPIVISPVKQKGHVDFLMFEDILVNDTSVEIDEYHREFDLPNKHHLKLPEPLRFYVYLPRAVLVAIDEWNESKPTWLITGRVYVFGNFKKSFLSFKRCIPIELKMTIRNPLRTN